MNALMLEWRKNHAHCEAPEDDRGFESSVVHADVTRCYISI